MSHTSLTVSIRPLSDVKGRPEFQSGDGPEEGNAASPGTQKHRALPQRPCEERDGLQQIQGSSSVFTVCLLGMETFLAWLTSVYQLLYGYCTPQVSFLPPSVWAAVWDPRGGGWVVGFESGGGLGKTEAARTQGNHVLKHITTSSYYTCRLKVLFTASNPDDSIHG